jgi:hypothetical protein
MPRDVRDVFYQKVGEGHTIQEITDWLRQLGQDISRAAVGREVKDFVGQLNRFKAVKEQAKAIVSEAGGDGLNLEEAAVTVALNNIMEYLMDPVLSNMQQEEASKVMMALARLQSSSVQREKLKMDFKDKLAKEAEAIGKMAKAEGLSDELADAIKKKILGIAA